MKKSMTLKEFIEYAFKENMFEVMDTIRELVELEGIEKNLNIMWGIKLDIKVKPAERKEGRFFGKNTIESLLKCQSKNNLNI